METAVIGFASVEELSTEEVSATELESATEEVETEEAGREEEVVSPQEAMVAKANKPTKPDKNFFFILTSFN
jgi:hypothetical protein